MIDTAFARYYLYDIGVSPQYQIYNIEPCTMPDCGQTAGRLRTDGGQTAGRRRASGGQAAGKRRAIGGHVAAIIIIIACDNIKMIIANILTWLTRL